MVITFQNQLFQDPIQLQPRHFLSTPIVSPGKTLPTTRILTAVIVTQTVSQTLKTGDYFLLKIFEGFFCCCFFVFFVFFYFYLLLWMVDCRSFFRSVRLLEKKIWQGQVENGKPRFFTEVDRSIKRKCSFEKISWQSMRLSVKNIIFPCVFNKITLKSCITMVS